MQSGRVVELLAQRFDDGHRQHSHSVFEALAIANKNLLAREVHILHPEPHPFHDAHPGSIKQAPDQRVHAVEPIENSGDLVVGEHDRQAPRSFGLLDLLEPRQLDTKYLFVQEEQRALRLVLRRPRNLPRYGEMSEESFDFRGTQERGVPLAVEPDEAFNPVDIRLLRADAVVLQADPVPDAGDETRGSGGAQDRATAAYRPLFWDRRR